MASITTLNDLIEKLHQLFEDDVVDVDHVMQVFNSYKSNPAEWKKFAKFDRYRYTRNLVDEGNGKFNLMLLCWGEGHMSSIHDHADAHCFMKVSISIHFKINISCFKKMIHSDAGWYTS